MKDLIRKILKEAEEDLSWVHELTPDFDYEPGAMYYEFGDSEHLRSQILKDVVSGFSDLKINGDKIILEVGGYCDFVDLFYDDRRGTDGYINRFMAKKMLCEEDVWWEPYSNMIYDNNEWKNTLWDDFVIGNEKVTTEVLNYIKENYVSKVDYNPNQLDIFGNPPKKQNVVEINGRILDEDYFYELKNDLDELGDLINEEDEFLDLKRELRWAYDDAYNTAARDKIWNALNGSIEEIFGSGSWKTKEVGRVGATKTKHYMEFEITKLFWDTVMEFFHECFKYCVGKNKEKYSIDDISEHCEHCMTPHHEYSYFTSFYEHMLNEGDGLLNPRYQEWPDDNDVKKYFTESVLDRI